jgi:hypothetical protein
MILENQTANRPRFAAATRQGNPFGPVFSQDRRGLERNFCSTECSYVLQAEDGSRSGEQKKSFPKTSVLDLDHFGCL